MCCGWWDAEQGLSLAGARRHPDILLGLERASSRISYASRRDSPVLQGISTLVCLKDCVSHGWLKA